MPPLKLFYKKEIYYFLFFIFLLFCLNLFIKYAEYKHFKQDEVYQTTATVVNIYDKPNYKIIKLHTSKFNFFTSISKDMAISQLDKVDIFLVTTKVSFIEYLKGFYTKSFGMIKIAQTISLRKRLAQIISSEHQDKIFSSFYNALFLAIPINRELRDICSRFGISHLIAISGFHLGVISFVLYYCIFLVYNPIHQKFCPYRNKKYDILVVVSFILLLYVVFLGEVASLLRAFFMFIFGIFLLRNNIKILSFETLFVVIVSIIALFPSLLFSLSLWFSVAGVFYIFLFLHYFKSMPKYLQLVFFNIWIFLAINPIVHYFFPTTTLYQLYSPIFTLGFVVFYPFMAICHIVGLGDILDDILKIIFNIDMVAYDVFTPLWFLISYILVSVGSIWFRSMFVVLNILLFGYSLFIFK